MNDLRRIAYELVAETLDLDAALRLAEDAAEKCTLALVAGQPAAAPMPFSGHIAAAWGRLSDEQRAVVRRFNTSIAILAQQEFETNRSTH
ncbi:MAG: hypothetical protein P4M00_15010 [Azospirillaceae bacterium]|nr:hypothetical protein [Azospirillaceae bacterium]